MTRKNVQMQSDSPSEAGSPKYALGAPDMRATDFTSTDNETFWKQNGPLIGIINESVAS